MTVFTCVFAYGHSGFPRITFQHSVETAAVSTSSGILICAYPEHISILSVSNRTLIFNTSDREGCVEIREADDIGL